MSSTTSHITLVGLGNMGTALAHALVKAGRRVTIWNRAGTRPSVSELVQVGAGYGPELPRAIAGSSTIIFCVLDYNSIHQVMDPVVTSQGTDAREMDRWMHKHGAARYFDGGIMVTPQLISTSTSFILCSGENEALFNDSDVIDLIIILGRPHYVASDPGAAALYDLSLLAGMFGMFAGSMTAMALMQKQIHRDGNRPHSPSGAVKFTLEDRVSTLLNPLLNALVPYTLNIAQSITSGRMDENFGNPMAMVSMAMQNVLRACEEEGVDGGSLKYFADLMKAVVDERGGEVGIGWVSTLLTK
ncbi:uncharacterized protein Z518_07416 [Rhinocladiella mackenziei CBS 650.93]|uniref:6-phosphogluconate dehydrogenase NADP-binding domain-containing protein n=1 Tax=Rhinocladiella mackenziei CBS 650.93 TaxID=1442369 RepID=A0A0D2H0B2_9EURO|nr:uncharacterized protein Z518_07416 [Rhinocladiella mackenziei CBS 650.93]KIX03863.1 hypothetical protein Z518_07416 [Rhinocladiella mackenziei CBS 650.93]